jgi:hypothetical protein
MNEARPFAVGLPAEAPAEAGTDASTEK